MRITQSCFLLRFVTTVIMLPSECIPVTVETQGVEHISKAACIEDELYHVRIWLLYVSRAVDSAKHRLQYMLQFHNKR